MTKVYRLAALFILVSYRGLGLAYGLVVPPFENLDEVEHLGAIRYIADTGRLPAHRIPAAEGYHYRNVTHTARLVYQCSRQSQLSGRMP